MTLPPPVLSDPSEPILPVMPDPPGWALNGLLWPFFIALSTLTQLSFKLASKPLEHLDFDRHWLEVAYSTPAFVVACVSYILTFAIWIVILQRTPLSKAFLLTALVYVTVTLGSGLWLGETINLGQMGGISLVIVGIALLGVPSRAKR